MFTPDGLEQAVDAAGGLPYAMQLIGWHAYDVDLTERIGSDALERAMPAVHGKLLTGLRLRFDVSPSRRAFLEAMAHDDGPSRMADVARRLDRTPQQLSARRAWLKSHGYISTPAHGTPRSTHLGMRTLLRTHPDFVANSRCAAGKSSDAASAPSSAEELMDFDGPPVGVRIAN